MKLREGEDYVVLQQGQPKENAAKAVIGPGTGLGQGFLTKSELAPYYEVFPAEGGHSEFSPRNEEDFELVKHAKKFIEESDNIENLRGKGHVERISVERVCAGPAIPLIYDFMRTRYPDLERGLEKVEGYNFNVLEARNVIEQALLHNDPLCLKVVEKFTEIFAVEAANLALKTLPLGGLYLIGGVTTGISEYMKSSKTFLDNFNQKGRLSSVMVKIPIYLVLHETQVGILGAEEKAFRVSK